MANNSLNTLTTSNPANLTASMLVGTNLVYPSNLDTSNYYMMFQFVEYQRPNIFSSGYNKAVGGIAMPLPSQLKDAQALNYTDGSANPAVASAVESGINAARSAGNYSTAVASGLVKTAMAGAAGAASGAAQNAVGAEGVNYALSLVGMAVNPFLTVLFNNPLFKEHRFSWKMTPANSTDSERATAICNAFKYHSLPDLTGAVAGTLLSYPDMVYISIYPQNGFMYNFKPCVIKGVTIDYAANGPSFFKSNQAPTCIELSLDLQEIEYNLKKDWNVNGDGTVSQNVRSTQ